jgi:hypothetical protein
VNKSRTNYVGFGWRSNTIPGTARVDAGQNERDR